MTYRVGKYTLPEYSVLMSVYDRELPENLNESLESMLMQSYPPSDFVLVCDGKLTCELNIIVKSFQDEFKHIFHIVQIDENVGVGKAYNEGIKACKCDYIVKMDSDDISLPNRCLKQMTLFAVKPKLDIIGTYVEEFDTDTDEVVSVKKVPVMHKDIASYSKRRNPFNRQSVAFRKSFAEKIGGYSDLKMCDHGDGELGGDVHCQTGGVIPQCGDDLGGADGLSHDADLVVARAVRLKLGSDDAVLSIGQGGELRAGIRALEPQIQRHGGFTAGGIVVGDHVQRQQALAPVEAR